MNIYDKNTLKVNSLLKGRFDISNEIPILEMANHSVLMCQTKYFDLILFTLIQINLMTFFTC